MALVGTQALGTADIVIIVLYFLGIIGTSIFAMCKSKRDTTAGYFLAGRFITFIPIGASLFASNVGSEHFIGLAGSGAASGLGVSAFELLAVFSLLVLGWLFLPVYMSSGVHTLPEYIAKRFEGRRIQTYLAVLSLTLYILTKVSVTLFAAALFVNAALHWDFVPSIVLIIGVTALCTISGGLAAVIYTDTVQAFLMCIGSLILTGFAFVEVGGIGELFRKYIAASPSDRPLNSTCGLPRHDGLLMLRDPVGSDFPWPGVLTGHIMVSIWYWCCDQVIVQRALAAKGLSHGQGGTIVAGYLKVLPLFMIVMPGMISRVLYTDDIACTTPEVCKRVCNNEVGCSNLAYPWLIMNLLPTGLRGLMVAVMLAAMVSNLTSIFNSTSSIFTMDLYPLVRKNPSNREQMIVGRLFVVVMTVVSIVWIPIVRATQGAQLYVYLQSVQSFMAPPIAVVFLISVLWSRATEPGAFWALLTGFISGLIRLILEFVYVAPQCGEVDTRPSVVVDVNFLYFAAILSVQTVIVMVVVTLFTQPAEDWRLIRTIYWRRFEETVRPDEIPKYVTEYLSTKTCPLEVEPEQSIRKRHCNIPGFALEAQDGINTSQDPEEMAERKLLAANVDPEFTETDTEPVETTPSCWQRLGAPSSHDQSGNGKSCGRLTVDWLRCAGTWFCGFSLDGSNGTGKPVDHFRSLKSDEEKDTHARRAECDAQQKVAGMVKSIEQRPRVRLFLFINLLLILAIMISIAVFFSVPTQLNQV